MKFSALGRAALAAASLFASIAAHAAAIDLVTTSRDATIALGWIELSDVRELPYQQVTFQIGLGDDSVGWRYMTSAEQYQL